MNLNKIRSFVNDKNYFLEDYIKENLPSLHYKLSFYRKIKLSNYIKNIKLEPRFIDEINRYWDQYGEKIDLMWHKAYIATTNIKDVKFIPENIFYKKIEPTLNKTSLSRAYSDKNIYDKLFKKFKMPGTIIRNIHGDFYDKNYNKIDLNTAISIVLNKLRVHKRVVIKPSIETGGGKGVAILDENDDIDGDFISDLLFKYGQDFIIQNYLKQHIFMKKIHSNSLNTIRIMTLRLNGNIYILSSIIRMGNNGSLVDNASAGGLTCGINHEGKLNDFATDHLKYQKYESHPFSDFIFKDSYVPNIDNVFKLTKKAHRELLHFDIVSWDLAIEETGNPYLIEVNLRFQDINFHQRNNGPLLDKYTNKVLDKIYN